MRKIKIVVSKTFQEKRFEPFTCSLELEENADSELNKNQLDDLYFQKYDEMEFRLDEIIAGRMEEGEE